MNDYMRAIESVADKRHLRLMNAGLTEKEAAQKVVLYLSSLLNKWQRSTDVQHFIKCLIKAYSN